MINRDNLHNAYKECIEILKYVPKSEFDKIPNYIIENMIKGMNSNYNYKVIHFNDFENQDMLEETKAILAVLYREYLATEEEKIKIKTNENYDMQLLEIEKKSKYKTEDIFKNKSISKEEIVISNQVIKYKKNIFERLKEGIVKIFDI